MSSLRDETIRRILWVLPVGRIEIAFKTGLNERTVDKYLNGLLINKKIVFSLVGPKKLRLYDKALPLELNHDFWKVDKWTN